MDSAYGFSNTNTNVDCFNCSTLTTDDLCKANNVCMTDSNGKCAGKRASNYSDSYDDCTSVV